MNKQNHGQEDRSKFQGERKPTNLEARLEEARALRKVVLAQREQGIEGANEGSDPEIGSDSSGMLADDKLIGATDAASQTDPQHEDAPTPETLAPADLKRERVIPPLQEDRRRGRVAERLALGLGIGLGIGASLYLGAYLSGSKVGFVTADVSTPAVQTQQTQLELTPIETNEIISPTYVSLIEPEAVNTNIPPEIEQEAESLPSARSETVSSGYEMAPEEENADNAQPTLQSPDDPLIAPIIEASLNSDELDSPPSLLPNTSDIAPDQTSDTQSEPAPPPAQDIVKALIADPTAILGAELDAPAETGAEPTPQLAELDQRLLGAEAYTVVLNAPSTLSDDEVASVAKDIVGTGASLAKVDRVNFRISETQIRFFNPDDAATAAAIAERMGAEARDFTSYRPSPPAGTIEMFLAGGGRSAATKRSLPKIEDSRPTKRTVKQYPSNDNR